MRHGVSTASAACAQRAAAHPDILHTCAVLYILWAYTPDSVLQAHGINYYPSKYWAVALPAWVCVAVVFVYWLYERCVRGLRAAGSFACLTCPAQNGGTVRCCCSIAPYALEHAVRNTGTLCWLCSIQPCGPLPAATRPRLCSLCMMSAPPPCSPASLHDSATKRKEDVGMPSYFGDTSRSIPPLADIPLELVSMVLHGGVSPQGRWVTRS